MAAELVEIADAIKTSLQGELSGWSVSATVQRKFVPTFDLKNAATTLLTVIPRSTLQQAGSMQSNDYRHRIDVDVRRALDADDVEGQIGGLVELAALVADHCHLLAFEDPHGKVIELETTSALDEEEKTERMLFVATVALTVQTWRAAR
jgi:hypothetical protein